MTEQGPTINKWMRPDRTAPMAELADGTPLFQAYYRLALGERYRSRMGFWNGAQGIWVAVTREGQLYRQARQWRRQQPRPDRWERFSREEDGVGG
ncbi:MAG: hypothetical protein KAJ19_16820 [Gammaproteobacteria bacterium]|nr:hypothetical protein [Gammaproteobacteria bacterium]